MNNPIEMIKKVMLRNNNPVLKNLINLAQNGKQEEVENFARNLFKENGRDFDKEFATFMNNFR